LFSSCVAITTRSSFASSGSASSGWCTFCRVRRCVSTERRGVIMVHAGPHPDFLSKLAVSRMSLELCIFLCRFGVSSVDELHQVCFTLHVE
jgi:hypothetical protein